MASQNSGTVHGSRSSDPEGELVREGESDGERESQEKWLTLAEPQCWRAWHLAGDLGAIRRELEERERDWGERERVSGNGIESAIGNGMERGADFFVAIIGLSWLAEMELRGRCNSQLG